MKKRISLLLAAVTLTLAACTTAAPGGTVPSETDAPTTTVPTTQAEPSLRLTLAFTQAEDSLPGQGAAVFSEKLGLLSDEKLTCTLLPGGTMGTDTEVTAMLQSAKCDLGLLPVSALTELCPELEVLGLPFLFESYQEAREILDGEAGQALTERLTASGLHCLGWMTTGFRQVTANRAVTAPEDFRNLSIHTQTDTLHQAVFQALGAIPTAVNADELPDALEQGAVDGQEDTYLNIRAKELSRVQSHVMETNHVLELSILVMSDAAYQSLTDQQRAWLEQAASAAADEEWAAAIEENEVAKQDCIEKGMTAITLGRQSLVDAAGPVYDEYRTQYGELMRLFNR